MSNLCDPFADQIGLDCATGALKKMMGRMFFALLLLQAVLPPCMLMPQPCLLSDNNKESHDWCNCRLDHDLPTCCDKFGFDDQKCLIMDTLYQ